MASEVHKTAKTLLIIPLELRQTIFKELFGSTVVSHGFGSTGSTHTGILRTCRQFYSEAKPLMALNISLHFNSPKAIVDCLTTLDASDIQDIRNIRLKTFPVQLFRKKSCYTTFFMSLFPIFPGLQLDCLTVEGRFLNEDVHNGWDDYSTFFDIENLLRSGGCKELHFVSPTAELMSLQNDHSNARAA